MKTIHALKIWATRRPWQFSGFMVFFVAVFIALDYLPFDPVTSLVFAIAHAGAAIGVILVITDHYRTPLIVALSFALTSNGVALEEKKNAAGVGVAIVVVCVGGFCVYKVIRFCQKKFPKDAPGNTNELSNFKLHTSAFSGGVGDEYGGSWNFGSLGSCLPNATTPDLSSSNLGTSPTINSPSVGFNRPTATRMKSSVTSATILANASGQFDEHGGGEPDTTTGTTIFVLNVTVQSTTSLKIAMASSRNEDLWQSWTEFQSDMTSHGLTVTGQADGSQYFSLNGAPVSAGEVPLRFDTATGQVIHDRGGELVTIVVEASTDLENWQQLASVQHGVGEGFQIADVSGEEKTFYRVLIAP